jgi:Restriction endonuclease
MPKRLEVLQSLFPTLVVGRLDNGEILGGTTAPRTLEGAKMIMTASEYEAYVSEVVQQLDFGKTVSVLRNKRFRGVRQPGDYEIDIALQATLAGVIDFFLIVECKNWSRPVDRPVVQKLAQTRDAIAAHKAAIVSPVGFTTEAVDVAKAHGIALWVMSVANWSIVMGVVGPGPERWGELDARQSFLQSIGFYRSSGLERSDQENRSLVNFAATEQVRDQPPVRPRYVHQCVRGSATVNADNLPGVDPRLALSEIAEELGHKRGMAIPPPCRY